MTTEDELRTWLGLVAGFVMPLYPADAMDGLLRLEPALRGHPAKAFTQESAERVACAKRHGPVPDLAVVLAELRAYLREIEPIRERIAAPREAPERGPRSIEEIANREATAQRVQAMLREAFPAAFRNPDDAELPKPAHRLRDVSLSGDELAAIRQQGLIKPQRRPP